MKDFNGKVVVVTGAASGIGREIALAFADRGANLAICDINDEELRITGGEIEKMGRKVFAEKVDVSDSRQVERFCENVYRYMGRVDVLCNNAGINLVSLLDEVTLEEWERIIGVNLWGVIYGCHFFYPRMIRQGGEAHIINIASMLALFPLPSCAPYVTTKYAIMGLSETLLAEAFRHGIRVSVVCPCLVPTGMSRKSVEEAAKKSERMYMLAKGINKIVELRNYPPAKIAAAVVKAVEKNRSVVPVGFDTYLLDWVHRLIRRFFLDFIKATWKLLFKKENK